MQRYSIDTSDRLNIKLIKHYTGESGQEIERVLGYYTTVLGATKAAREKMIAESNPDINNIEQVVDIMEKSEKKAVQLLKETIDEK